MTDLPIYLKKYSVFKEGIGKLEEFKAKSYVNQDACPIYSKAHRVLYAVHAQVEQELERLEQLGIIGPISFSEWAAPIIPALKADKKTQNLW